MWIGGFCVVGGAAHAAIFMVRDYTLPTITIIIRSCVYDTVIQLLRI
jgi:hypothetical protein